MYIFHELLVHINPFPGDHSIVEIKCPYSARGFSPIDALNSGIAQYELSLIKIIVPK